MHDPFSMRKKILRTLLPLLFFPCLHAEDVAEETATEEEEYFPLSGNWRGARTEMRRKGIEISPSIILDDTWNLHGGKKRSSATGVFEYLFDLNLKMDTKKFLHYTGGTLFVDFQAHHGQSPSKKEVGSLVPVDYIEAFSFDSLAALWYRQAFRNDRFSIQVGKSDAYENFTRTDHSALFLNAAYTAIPTIFLLPTYPNPAMSVILYFDISSAVSLTAGVFDGSLAEGINTGKLGLFGRFFDLPKHAFLIGELGFSWMHERYRGHLGAGAWKTTANLKSFSGKHHKGTGGPYLTLDQVIYKPMNKGLFPEEALYENKEEAGVFFICGCANPSLNHFRSYFGGGIAWQGAIASRPDDIVGIATSYAILSQNKDAGFTKAYEASYEASYQLRFASWGYLQPDIQYIVHPGGASLPNATVFTLRLQFLL